MDDTKLKPLLDWQLILLGLVILFFVNINQLQNWTQAANFSLYDKQLQILPTRADPQILIIEIDEQSLSLLGEWPWPRSYHGQMIERLTQADVAAIAYNVVFTSFNQQDKSDLFLAQAIEKSGRTILPLYFDRLLKSGEVSEVLPADAFHQYAGLGHVNSYLDSDGTLRKIRLMERFYDHQWPHFSYASFLFNQPYSTLYDQAGKDVYIPFVNEGDFDRLSFIDVLTGAVPLAELSQRTVFVGMTATSMGDPLITPVDDKGRQSPAVDINANIYQALKGESIIQPLAVFASAIINSLVILIALYLIPRLSGVQQFIMTAISVVAVWFLSYGLLVLGYWYPSAGLMMALLVIPFIWNLLRLSRLFNYFRLQLNHLKQQQLSEIFRLPERIQLNTESDLKSLLSLLQIDNYHLAIHAEKDQGSMLSIVKSLAIELGRQEKLLVLYFDEFTALEKRKLNLLTQLLGTVGSLGADNKLMTNNSMRSDVFSQQLSLVDSYQQQVAMNHSMFEASIEGIAAGILVTDLAGKVLFCNQAIKQITNSHIASSKDLSSSIVLLQDDWITIIRNVILLQQAVTVEAKTVEPIARPMDLSVSIRCIEDQENLAPLLVFNLTDISQVKQAQRSRNEMIDFLSHDLRSPMASLQALVYQTRSEAGPDNAELLNKVDHYSQRGLDFAEQFLNLAKVESEENIQIYEVDLYSVSQNAVDSLYHQAEEKSIKLVLDSIDECWVMANGELLERVIINLVSNAIKYSPSQSDVSVTIHRQADQLIEVRVADQGPGIPSDLMDTLFKPYQRGSDNNTQQAQGIGLGLRFVDVALKRLDSAIQFESSANGASFYFMLESIDL